MILIELTSISGTPPYDISICDLTKTFCYVVATGTPSVPLYLDTPNELSGANQLLVVITDFRGCEFFQLITCITPTPTPTITPTPTPSMVVDCNCLTFTNLSSSNEPFGYTRCDGFIMTDVIYSGTSVYVCGKDPVASSPVTYTIGEPCIDNTCPDPSPTPTPTPTITPTNTPTVTVTPTNNPTPTPTNTPTVTVTPTPTNTPTVTVTPTITPTPTPTPTISPTVSWSLSSITFSDNVDVTSFINGATNAAGTSPWVDDSGNRLYLIDFASRTIEQLSLSISNDISSTITSIGTSSALADSFTTLQVSDDGSKVYVSNTNTGGPYPIRQYDLSTNWDITTMSTTAASTLSFPTNDFHRGFCFNKNGTVIYGVYSNGGITYSVSWTLSSAWDLSTAGSPTTSDIDSILPTPTGLLLIVESGFETLIFVSSSVDVALRGGITTGDLFDSYDVTLPGLSTSDNNDFIYGLTRSGSSPNYVWTLEQFNTNV